MPQLHERGFGIAVTKSDKKMDAGKIRSEYEYGNGEDGLVMGDVTMDDAGVPLLTIDARDGSVIQRIQAGWAVSTGDK